MTTSRRSWRAGVKLESRRAVEHGELGELAWQGERSLGSRKKFTIFTELQVQGSLHGELGELQGGSREEEHVVEPKWTWAGEEVGSRERGSTGRHSGGTLKTATNTLTEPWGSCHRRRSRTWSEGVTWRLRTSC